MLKLARDLNVKTTDLHNIQDTLAGIRERDALPEPEILRELTLEAIETLAGEKSPLRPCDDYGRPGGIIFLDPHLHTLIIPDIHGRLDFLFNLMLHEIRGGRTVLQELAAGELQIVCVGDGMHGESRAAERWLYAREEYLEGYESRIHMDQEMRESLGVMEMVIRLKCAFPGNFHYLKGNHDNIANEHGNGNYPFMKYALEGPMVTEYILMFYGMDFLLNYYAFEKKLPLLAVGRHFLISHAEPASFFSRHEILNYRSYPEVIQGLTWTDNGQADEGSVRYMIDEFIHPRLRDFARYFGGHRPVKGLYNLRAHGRYVQIHNPAKNIIASISPSRRIRPDSDIYEIEDLINNQQRGSLS